MTRYQTPSFVTRRAVALSVVSLLCCAGTATASDLMTAAGGSNFSVIRSSLFGPATVCPEDFTFNDLSPIIGVYDNPAARALINQRLDAMYAAGQRKIGIFIWHYRDRWQDQVRCYRVRAQGILSTTLQNNLRDFVQRIKQTGFNQINVRFGPDGDGNPMSWVEFDEAQYQSNWNVVVTTRALVYESLSHVPGQNPRVLIDLAAEFGGRWLNTQCVESYPIALQYATRLWGDYTYSFGTSDTIGFSTVPACAGMSRAPIDDVYDVVGQGRPTAYGFDVYGNFEQVQNGNTTSITTQFDWIKAELGATGELGKEIFLQETYFNSAAAWQALRDASRATGLRVAYVFQWPLGIGTDGNTHFNVDDVSPFTFYLPGFSATAIYQPASGMWYQPGYAIQWGLPDDVPVPADYDGDGQPEFAVWRPSNGTWYALWSSRGYSAMAPEIVQFGLPNDIPIPADFDGDGRAELAVWRPADGMWHVRGLGSLQWGLSGDTPVVGDFDGDHRSDLGVFRAFESRWLVLLSSQGYTASQAMSTMFGGPNDVPVIADYTGDGQAEIAIFRPSTGEWQVAGFGAWQWGSAGDIPVVGDYDGDGKADLATFTASTSAWKVLPSAATYSAAYWYPMYWGGHPSDVFV